MYKSTRRIQVILASLYDQQYKFTESAYYEADISFEFFKNILE